MTSAFRKQKRNLGSGRGVWVNMGSGKKADLLTKCGSWAGLGVSILAALLIGPLATTARAAFSAPIKLSATRIAGAKAVLDADGDAIAVWSHYDGKKWRVQERRISATGSLGPVKTISPAADKAALAADRRQSRRRRDRRLVAHPQPGRTPAGKRLAH